jgi:hypothetical protein
MFLGLSAATFDHNFGQAPPSMEFKAALASSIVAYLPNSLYLALLVEVSSLPGMTRHCLVRYDISDPNWHLQRHTEPKTRRGERY